MRLGHTLQKSSPPRPSQKVLGRGLDPPLPPALASGGPYRGLSRGSVVRNGPCGQHGAALPRSWATRCRQSLPPPTQRNCLDEDCFDVALLLFSEHALSGLSARLGQQGRGGGLAARGEMCMQGATNLMGEAAEASLASPSMLERCASTVFLSKVEENAKGGRVRAVPSTPFLSRRGCSGPVSWGVTG